MKLFNTKLLVVLALSSFSVMVHAEGQYKKIPLVNGPVSAVPMSSTAPVIIEEEVTPSRPAPQHPVVGTPWNKKEVMHTLSEMSEQERAQKYLVTAKEFEQRCADFPVQCDKIKKHEKDNAYVK